MEKQNITEQIIGASYKVHKILGAGFLEKVYHNALLIELQSIGLRVVSEYPIQVFYSGNVVGEYYADLMVEGDIIVEIKAVEHLLQIHEVQLVNYLAATKLDFGLLINFGSSVEVRRKYRIYRPSIRNK